MSGGAVNGEAREMTLAVDQIRADPDRLSRSRDRESLQELARSMAVLGLLQPITVCCEGADWLVVFGERRLQAARLLGWRRITVRVIPHASPMLRRIMQATENLHRSAFSLIEMSDVVVSVKETGIPVPVMAEALARPAGWIEALLRVARDPVARVLLDAERLSTVEAWEQFMRLSPAARKRLLQSDEPITSERCQGAGRGERKFPPGASAARPMRT